MSKNCAVAIHGCHVGAVGWEDIIWGDPKNNILGRAARGIEVANSLGDDCKLLSWSTGASERSGLKESELMYQYARERMQDVPGLDTFTVAENIEWLEKLSVIDTKTQNTREEIENIGQLCMERDISDLYLVSSPWHIQRCLKEALILRAEAKLGTMRVFAIASDDSTEMLSAKQVVILEPPHRGDDPMLKAKDQMHRVIPKLFSLTTDKRMEFLTKMNNELSK